MTNNEINEKKQRKEILQTCELRLRILKDCELIFLALPIKDLINPSKHLTRAAPMIWVRCWINKKSNYKDMGKNTPFFYRFPSNGGYREKGINSGFKDLFNNAKWIITLLKGFNALNTLSKLINSMECKVWMASPKEHDEVAILISHLPIFLACSLIELQIKIAINHY